MTPAERNAVHALVASESRIARIRATLQYETSPTARDAYQTWLAEELEKVAGLWREVNGAVDSAPVGAEEAA